MNIIEAEKLYNEGKRVFRRGWMNPELYIEKQGNTAFLVSVEGAKTPYIPSEVDRIVEDWEEFK